MSRFKRYLFLITVSLACFTQARALVPNPNCSEISRAYVLFASDTSMQFVIEGMNDSVQVEYGLSGFTQGTGTFLTTAEDTFTIGGLQSDTTYDFYFENNCKGAGNGVSLWSDVYSFETAQIVSLPYTNDFNSSFGEFTETYFTDAPPGGLILRWERTGSVPLYTIPGGFSHANGTTFARLQSQSGQTVGATYREAVMTSPILDTTGMKEKLIMEWDEHPGGLSPDIQVYDGSQWVHITPFNNGSPSNWYFDVGDGVAGRGRPSHKMYDITAYANPQLMIRWKSVNPWTTAEPFYVIDDFKVRHVDCVESRDFRIEDAGPDWVHLQWNSVTAVGFKLEYGPTGFTPGSGNIIRTTGNTLQIDSLSPGTAYEFLLTDSCANGTWLDQYRLTVAYTTPDSLRNGPYYADFDSGWDGFSVLDNTPSTPGWVRSGGRVSVIDPNWYTGLSSDEYLIAPPVYTGNIPTGGSLKIEYGILQSSVLNYQSSKVYVEMYNGSFWQAIQTHNGPVLVGIGQTPISQTLSVSHINQPITRLRFRFHAKRTLSVSDPWVIDDVRISGDCGNSIANFDTTQVNAKDVNLSWTTTGTMVNLRWGQQGFDPYTQTTNSLRGITSTSQVISNLQPNSCYDVYISDTCAGFIGGSWIGPLNLCTDLGNCALPPRVELSFASDTSIQLVVVGMADSAKIEYGLSGFIQGSGNFLTTGDDTVTIGGLQMNTIYDFYFQNDCRDSGNGFSLWSGVYSFETAQKVSLPYTNDFNSSFGEFTETYFTDAPPGNAVLRWQRATTVLLYTIIGGFYHANGTSFALLQSTSGQAIGATHREAVLMSPILDTSGMKETLIMEWDQHGGGSVTSIEAYDGSQWVNITPLDNGNASGWLFRAFDGPGGRGTPSHKVYDITAYANPQLMIRWKSVNPGTIAEPFMVIDDFEVRHADCIESRDFRIDEAGPDWVHLSWRPRTATGFKVEYGPSGFTPGTGISLNTTADTMSIYNLDPNTNYEFILTDSCANGAWLTSRTQSADFTTADSIQQLGYFANFSGGTDGFGILDNTPLSSGWSVGANGMGVTDPRWHTYFSSDEYLFAPPIQIGTRPAGSSLTLEYAIHHNHTPLNPTKLHIEHFDGSTWQNLQTHQGIIYDIVNNQTVPKPFSLDLSNLNQSVLRLRFRVHFAPNSYHNGWILDDVRISGSCADTISNFDTLSVGLDSAVVSWSTTGSMVNLKWGPTGFNPDSVSGAVARGITDTSYVISALQSDSCYDVYIQDTCANFVRGDWTSLVSFCTDIPYCPELDRLELLFASDTSLQFAVIGMSDSVRIEYGLSGFVQGGGTFLKTDQDTFTVGGLLSSSAYEFYIENNCKATGNGISNRLGPYAFNTSQRVSLPHTENFDVGFGLLEERHYGDSIAPPANTVKWRVSSTVIGPTCGAFRHLNMTDFAALEGQFGPGVTGFKEAFLTSPIYDTSGFKEELFVEWDEHCNGCGFGRFQVYDGTTWMDVPLSHSVTNWDICNRTGLGAGTPAHKAYDITPYANSNLKVRFAADNSSNSISTGEFWVIDDFVIRTVDCLESTGYKILDAGPDWVDLKWNGGTAAGFKIEYGAVGFSTGSGTEVFTSVDSIRISGLSPNIHYEFLLTDSCQNGVWLTQYVDTVDYLIPDSLGMVPYMNDFASGANGFSILNNTPQSSGWSWNSGVMKVSNPLWHFGGSSSEYLFSPSISTGTPPTGGALILEYDLLQVDILSSQTAKLYVELYDGSTWQNVQTHQGPYFTVSPNSVDPALQTLRLTNISHPVASVRFKSDWDENDDQAMTWIIDNIRMYGDCGDTISNLDTSWVGKDRAAISWSNTGGMVNLSWGPSGYDPYQTGTVKRAITSLQDTIPGLSWNTCYDVYIADTCSGFIQGDWIGPLSFCTDSSLCPTPSQVQLNFVGTDSAYFSWTSSGGLLSTTLEYGPAGFARGSGTVFYTTGGNAGIGSLSSLTAYDVYIQDSCLANDLSFWAKLSFTTLDTPMVAPFFQNFDSVPSPPVAYHPLNFASGTDYFPESWLNYSADGKLWEVDTSVVGGPANDHTTGSGKYAFVDDGAQPNAMGVLMTTPLIDISALNWPSLQFYHWGSGLNSNLLHVDLWNGQQWLDDILQDSIGTNSTWKQGIVDLAAYPISGNIMIRFRVDEDSSSPLAQNSISIDDVSIDEMPICPSPIWPQETLSTCKSISLVGYDHPNIDSVLIEYGPAFFTPGSGVLVSLFDMDTLTIGSLSGNTAYDIYLANICNGDSSSYIGPITVTTDQDSSTAAFTHSYNTPNGLTFTSTGHRPGDSLQWDFGDGSTDTGAVVTHSYSGGGAYTVRLIVSNECQTDTAILLLANVGIEERWRPIKTFELYPNPATDEITIVVDFLDRIASDIDIIDVNGRSVFHQTFEPRGSLRLELDIGQWSRGMYSIRVRTNRFIVQSKVIMH